MNTALFGILVAILLTGVIGRLAHRLLDWALPARLNFGAARLVARIAIGAASTKEARDEARDAYASLVAADPAQPEARPLALVAPVLARCVRSRLPGSNERVESLVVDSSLRANLSFATAIAATVDARDPCYAGHSAVVAMYARDIALRLGLSESDQALAHFCGLVHDVGKIGVPPDLFAKPGPLTLDERRQMEEHATIGEQIFQSVDGSDEVAAAVRHHHERVDGQGYPDGLLGTQIPLHSRIVAVADAYAAMVANRPYRDAMPSSVARLRLAQAVETQFDVSVVSAFERVLATADGEYWRGQGEAFTGTTQEGCNQDSSPVWD
jgi:putative nucleotidyltransferase with HDIG domain